MIVLPSLKIIRKLPFFPAFARIYKVIGKNVEFPRKLWAESIFTAWSYAVTVLLLVKVILDSNMGIISTIEVIASGILCGSLVSFVISERIKRRYLLIALLTIGDALGFLIFLSIPVGSSGLIDIFLIFLIIAMSTIILIDFLVILFQTTGILERGRVISGIFISGVFAVPLYALIGSSFFQYFLVFFLILYVGVVLSKHMHNELYLSPKATLKGFFTMKLIKYWTILCGIGFIEGLFINSTAVLGLVNELPPGFLFLVFPVLLVVSFFVAGIVFDIYGRRRSISLIVFLLGTYVLLSYFSSSGMLVAVGLYFAVLVLIIVAILTIIGDTSIYPARAMPVTLLLVATSLGIGIYLRIVFESLGSPDIPLYLGNFGLILVSMVLINTADTLSAQEKAWDKSLIAIYVMHTSGMLLYHKDFRDVEIKVPHEETGDDGQHDLISSGLVGITQMLQEILKGKQIARAIDHYSKKILLEAGKNIIVALIVHIDLRVLRDKLKRFIQEFEIEFFDELDDPKGVDMQRFDKTADLIKKYFDVKYLMGLSDIA